MLRPRRVSTSSGKKSVSQYKWGAYCCTNSGTSQRGRCRRGRSEIPHFSRKLQLFAPCSRLKCKQAKKSAKKGEIPAKKAKKSAEKGRFPPAPSTPTLLRTSQQMGGVLQYKWEAYCRVSFSSKLRSQESTAIQMGGRTAVQIGGVLPYLFRQVVGVGVSETLPIGHGSAVHLP